MSTAQALDAGRPGAAADAWAALTDIVGPANLLTAGTDCEAYETGWRYDRGRAAFVVRPGSRSEVSRVVACCAARQIRLIPQSGNTGLVGGSTPDDSCLQGVLSLDRLNRHILVDVANRSVEVDAGVRLSQLNAALEAHDLFFPIDLGADPMIGGMVATNTGGARFLRYGDVRHNLLGLEVVLSDPDGTPLELGGGLRKDNTGLDLKQLFVGTSGALGVVTRATLEVHPRPAASATALLVPRDDAGLLELLLLFERHAGDLLTAFESLSGNAIRAALAHVKTLRNPFAGGQIPELAVLVELTRRTPPRAGQATLDEELEALLAELWELPGSPLSDALLGRPEVFWALRHSLSEGLRAAGRVVAFDLSFRRSELPRFRTEMRSWLAEAWPEAEVCDFGHAGDGGVHFNLVVPRDTDPAIIATLRGQVLDRVVRDYAGSYSAEHALGRSNQAWYDRYTPTRERELAGALQRLLAPNPIGSIQLGGTELPSCPEAR